MMWRSNNDDNDKWQWHNGDYDEFLKSKKARICCRGKLLHQTGPSYDELDELINKLINH